MIRTISLIIVTMCIPAFAQTTKVTGDGPSNGMKALLETIRVKAESNYTIADCMYAAILPATVGRVSYKNDVPDDVKESSKTWLTQILSIDFERGTYGAYRNVVLFEGVRNNAGQRHWAISGDYIVWTSNPETPQPIAVQEDGRILAVRVGIAKPIPLKSPATESLLFDAIRGYVKIPEDLDKNYRFVSYADSEGILVGRFTVWPRDPDPNMTLVGTETLRRSWYSNITFATDGVNLILVMSLADDEPLRLPRTEGRQTPDRF